VGFEFGASVTMDMMESITGQDENQQSDDEVRSISFKCVESQFFSEFDGEWKVSSVDDPDDPTSRVSKVEYVVDVKPRGPVPVQALEWRIREDVPTNLRAVKAASMDLGAEGVLALNDKLRKQRNGVVATSSSSQATSATSRSTSTPTSTASTSSSRARRSQSGRRSTDRSSSGSFASVANSTRRNVGNFMNRAATASKNTVVNATQSRSQPKLAPVRVDWYDDETMGAYLNKRRNA